MSGTGLAQKSAPPLDTPVTSINVADAIAEACKRIAPLWPLSDFVAVNPFLGLADTPFGEAAALLKRIANTRLLMPRAFYAEALASGRIGQASLAESAARITLPGMTGAALAEAAHRSDEPKGNPQAVVATIAEVIDQVSGQDRRISLAGFMIDEISAFCAAYFDEGQALWALPTRALTPFAAWRELAVFDRNPECMGITGFRATIRALPADPVAAIKVIVSGLGIPDQAVVDYLYRALLDINGWAAYVRHFDWPDRSVGNPSDALTGLLAIRLAYGWALFRSRKDQAFHMAWQRAMVAAREGNATERETIGDDLAIDLAFQSAYEHTWRQGFVTDLRTKLANFPPQPDTVSAVQAAFCIDVRSEPIRRALESVHPSVETIGFAGFFGLPLGTIQADDMTPQVQCPVLLRPSVFICEAATEDGATDTLTDVLKQASFKARIKSAWQSFKVSAVSSFAFVEAFGLGLSANLLSATAKELGLFRPVGSAKAEGAMRIQPAEVNGLGLGMTLDAQIAYAQALFAGMSLKPPFAKLLVLVGHASTTTNNPHARSLDCGACGGHSGEPNVRIAAQILNTEAVQTALRKRGIKLPEGWCVIPALHDTLTDRITICDADRLPQSLRPEIKQLESAFSAAGTLARSKRAETVGLPELAELSMFQMRGHDWSEVRPEWGLANNAAFLAAPRRISSGLDLGGRVFLHTYDYQTDPGYEVLETILTAPLIVASWINLQYYASSVDPEAFGSGNKTLHNVVGKLGVFEGNGGDLRVGLPLQSVHDGDKLRHEPIRLQAFIAAPEAAIDAIIARHPDLHNLLVNQWIFLHALDPENAAVKLWTSPGQWAEVG